MQGSSLAPALTATEQQRFDHGYPQKYHRFPVSQSQRRSPRRCDRGRADAIVKGAEAELATLKNEFKARGLSEVAGDDFTVTASEQIAGRLDAKAVKAFL